MNSQTGSINHMSFTLLRLRALGKKVVLAALCSLLLATTALAQEQRAPEPVPEQRSHEQTASAKEAVPPADGLLQVIGPAQQPNLAVTDGEILFTSPGVATYARDIRLSDNLGGLRFYGANSLTTSPAGAAIQFFGNATSFPGQLYLDSGAHNSAALIFRTAGGPYQCGDFTCQRNITERMRIGANGNVRIGTTLTAGGGKLEVMTGGEDTPSDAVVGITTKPAGIGVLGVNHANGGWGVYGTTTNPMGLAGRFDGDVLINGNLVKGGGSFKIDHPLDPENKYLSHSFVESPDMMNIYNGSVVLNNRGEATVQMPKWFEALNRDFQYQLTCIGGFAPVYVAEEIKGNQFKIAGGKAGMKVSWQVTGIRHDAYAEAHRIKVEEDKPAKDRGTYLHPEVFGQPKEKGVGRARHAEQQLPLAQASAQQKEK